MSVDPIRRRRRQVARLASVGRKAGWAFFALALGAFITGLVVGLSDLFTVVVFACLALGSALLLPAIIVGFGVSAAEREDRG